ncbi:MAG: hypothetical protein APR54_07150 [Candidatus Cloacimonas sp. SDB]|nr:MAG: hypothetical protein APR54_07150 [Candidatus Cloacimonas sp. SDB]
MKLSPTNKILIILCAVLIVGGCLNKPKRDRFLIPDKFVGMVSVYYEVQGAEPLKMEDGYRLVVVPNSGIVRTSSEAIGGKLHDEYWLYSGNKRTKMSLYKRGGLWTEGQLGQKEVCLKFEVLKEERPHENDTFWSILTNW